ncbi:uncharacterized protein LW94_1435 [Fusarium fujikuroi]|nr:uncharacterized protein LW94_1435 [Fusarium fujikuroi]SCO37223.1 uncharacterized protein FFMR_04586 [Fusarium fujikuroi]
MTNNHRQALVAAFTFGLVAHAGITGAFLLLNNRASKIIRDAPRLALIAFLISSALWAQIDFFAFLLNINSMPGCQIMVTFASTFDQFARVSIQQSLLWIFSTHSLASLTEIGVMQGFIVLRLILGGVFVGIQRPQLNTICLTQTSILPVGITVSVIDTASVAFLLIRVISRGVYSETQRGAISPRQSRAVALVVLGLIIWTGTSAPLMLSIQPMSIVVRTTVPSVGLLILIGILTLFRDRLFSDNSKHMQPADVNDFDASRDFNTRQMTSADMRRPRSYDEIARTSAADFTGASKPWPVPTEPKRELPLITMPAAGQANIGMGGVPVLGQLFPLPRTQTLPSSTKPEGYRQTLHQANLSTSSSGSSSDSRTSASSQENWADTVKLAESQHSSLSSENTASATTSAFLSPGTEEVRRRSPRQSPRQLPSPALSIFPRTAPSTLQARTPTKAGGEAIVNFSLPVDARVPRPYQPMRNQPPKSAPLAVIPRSNANEIMAKREDSAKTLSVVHRPRPIPRKSNIDRALFPAEGSPNLQHHKRSLSCGSVRFKQPHDTPAEINYDLSRLNEFANVLHANIPTPTEADRITRRRSRSMVELPILPADIEFKPNHNEAKAQIDKSNTLTAPTKTPASLTLGETSIQFPKSPQPTTAQLDNEPVSATSSSWRDPHGKGYGRRSSPILPVEDLSALTPSTVRDEDFALDADIRSPAMQVHVQRALTVTVTAKHQQQSGLRVAETLSASSDESSREPLPLTVRKPSAEANVGSESELRRAEDTHLTAKQHFWPSQVGEIRPATFSDRGYTTKPRRSLPPAPLVFRRTDSFYAEPSPVESDLSEEDVGILPDRTHFGSPGSSYQIAENDRLALLTNLELELNEQEHQWQTIRHTMHVRDSLSTVGTSPSRDSRYWYGSARLSKLAQQRGQLDADYDILALFPQADSKSRTKLAASSTYPRFTNSLATPTPPDTDEESEYAEDHEGFIGHAQISPAKTAMVLWRPIASVQAVTSTSNAPSLWTPAPRPPRKISPVEIAGRSIRGPVRKDVRSLVIESSRLWEKPESKTEVSSDGLWQPVSQVKTQVVEVKVQQSKPPRNPPRRIKRVTMLPDILESPKPLPDRRGTLGIFQFPWGDRSDCATIAPMFMSGMTYQPVVDGGMQTQMQHSGSAFDIEDYEQDDGEYYDSSETYDSDDEDCFELAQPVPQLTDTYFHGAPPEKMSTSHEDELKPRSIDEQGIDSELLKHCETSEDAYAKDVQMQMHDGGRDDKANDRTSLRTQTQVKYDEDGDADSESESTQAGDYSAKAGAAVGAPPTSTTTMAMTIPDMDLREHASEKNRIRVRQQPQFGGQVASISMPVPLMARCLLMDVGRNEQDWAGAPITKDNGTHATLKSILDPCTDRESKSRGAPGAGHPHQQQQQATLLFRFLEDSISKPADLKLDCDSPTPQPLSPLVIYKSESPTRRRQILVINLLYPPSIPAQSSLQQTTNYPNISMALWTPSTLVSRPNKGLPQPDDSTWNSYLPAGEAARLLPAKADMPSIASNSLWTAPVKKAPVNNFGLWGTIQPLPGMWTQSPVNAKISYGLPQPDAETWATYLIVEDDATRVKPREAEPLPVDSTSLWTPAIPVISEIVSEDGLWSGSSSAPSGTGSEPSTPSETSAVNFGLWGPLPATASVGDEEPDGLFSLSHRRTDYRTTKLAPAAQGMERSPRRALEAFPDFGFTHLWNMAPLWDFKANAAAIQLQREIDSLVSEGLFSLNHRRNNFRTTSESPAALETRPKQRISQQSLPKLNTDSLWSVRASSQDITEINWLALSTVRSRTASVVSFTDSESVVSDVPALTRASSIKSEMSRPAATPAEWLAALDEAIRLGSGKAPEMDTEDPCAPDSDNYQLWSKPGADVGEPVIASDELWKPSTARFLELTPTLSEFDKQHIASGTSQRGRVQKARPPMPLYPGSSSSAFLPGASETPRDFSAQGLWVRAQSPAPGTKDDGSWIDKSLRKGLSFVQLW